MIVSKHSPLTAPSLALLMQPVAMTNGAAMISAIRMTHTGGPEVMVLTEAPDPVPGPGEVLVTQTAIGVNYIDTYHRSGLYPVAMPSGIGLEGAGVIAELGAGVQGLSLGQRVAYCSGPIGAYATKHVVKADRVVALPDGISDAQAAASLLKGLTCQYLIRQIYHCGAGDTVLFHAAAGGVGQIALQWLRHLGTTVIATVGSAEKAAIARDLGAEHVIDYSREAVAPKVREITGGTGVPVVYDGVGKDTFIASLDSLKMRGLLVSFGNASGPVRDVDLGILSAKGSLFVTRPTLFHYTATREALETAATDFFNVLLSGAVRLSAPTEYPLTDAARAHRDLEGRRTTGSLILRP